MPEVKKCWIYFIRYPCNLINKDIEHVNNIITPPVRLKNIEVRQPIQQIHNGPPIQSQEIDLFRVL